MANPIQLGIPFNQTSLPPVPEWTCYVDAGPVTIGIEQRRVTADLVEKAYGPEDRPDLVRPSRLTSEKDEPFLSVHIFDAASDAEHLRFDVTDEHPHYHYMYPGQRNVVVPYDKNACGEDMLDWAIGCLRNRLPAMLTFAGASDLATRIDQTAIEAAIPRIFEEARRARPKVALA
jgi:hypothetical protein